MVFFNKQKIVGGIFPNNEVYYNYPQNIQTTEDNFLTLIWENNDDLFSMLMYKKYLDDVGIQNVVLEIPFIPYGQMDRPMKDKIFTFKYVAKLINDAKFKAVVIIDPHSRVIEGAIDRATILYNGPDKEYDLYFYVDEGALKKYSEIFEHAYRFGNKKRNLETGEIIEYEVIGDKADFEGKNILIIDDICHGGRSFKEAAKALKALGAANIDLKITHLMPQAKEFYENRAEFGINDIFSSNTLMQDWYTYPVIEKDATEDEVETVDAEAIEDN